MLSDKVKRHVARFLQQRNGSLSSPCIDDQGKYNANQRYTTDAVSGAVFQAICQEAGVPVQRYSNRADLPGGSTLGNISTAHLSVPTVDIGLPQLAMHSICETAGAADTDYLVKAMTAYFSRDFHRDRDGGIVF